MIFLCLWVFAGFVIGLLASDYMAAMVNRRAILSHEIALGFVGALTAYIILRTPV